MKYSFIIPAYNEEALLGATLDQLQASATALTGGFEIIVVNDDSNDRTPEIAREKGVGVIDVKKRQIAAVRNAGATVASGEIFIFVDADTLVSRETLLDVEEALKDPHVVGGGAKLILDRPPPFWSRLTIWIFLTIYFASNHAAGGFIFARRQNFQKAAGFDERYFASEEIHFSRALKAQGKLKLVKHPVITSGRKFRMKTTRDHLNLFKHMARKGKKGWESREGLDMWYDGSREK